MSPYRLYTSGNFNCNARRLNKASSNSNVELHCRQWLHLLTFSIRSCPFHPLRQIGHPPYQLTAQLRGSENNQEPHPRSHCQHTKEMVFHSAVNKKTVERTISTRSTAITSGSDRNKNPVAPNNTQETNTATEDRRMADHQITLLKIPVQDPSEILNWVPVQVPVQDHA